MFALDQCGFAPTMPTSDTWARTGTRPLLRYEAPQGRRVHVLGALAPFGPRPRFASESRLASEGRLDSAAVRDFVCRARAGLPGGAATLDRPPAGSRRSHPCTVVLDHYGVHHSRPLKAALPTLATIGVSFYYLPPSSPELNRIEPEWHALTYDRLTERSFTTGPALKAAVDAALADRADELRHSSNHLLAAA